MDRGIRIYSRFLKVFEFRDYTNSNQFQLQFQAKNWKWMESVHLEVRLFSGRNAASIFWIFLRSEWNEKWVVFDGLLRYPRTIEIDLGCFILVYRVSQMSPWKKNVNNSSTIQAIYMSFSSFHRIFSKVLFHTYEIKLQTG